MELMVIRIFKNMYVTKNMKYFLKILKPSHIILHLKAYFNLIPLLFLNFKYDFVLKSYPSFCTSFFKHFFL